MPITAIPRSIKPASSVKFYGVGSSADKFAWGEANKNGIGLWLQSNAASGDARAIYARMYLNGAGGGEAIRAFATASTTDVATAGTMNGIHATASVATSSSISGAANAGRFTFAADAATRTLSGTLASLQLDTDIGTGNTLPASHAFIRFTNSGAVAFSRLFEVPTVASGGILAAHTTDAMTHSIRFMSAAGTLYYLMATTTVSNRTGGG
jgi:hypothetical protein